MIAYHGTTQARARKILDQGFLPNPPSRRVWFAESRSFAMGRARTQARRPDDIPVVLVCDLDLDELRRQPGVKRTVHRKGIIAVDGPVPAAMLRRDAIADVATAPEVAAWISDLLRLKPWESVRPTHPGLVRLSRWINARAASVPEPSLLSSELLERAKRWLPEYFTGAHVPVKTLLAHRRVGLIKYEVDARASEPDPREAEALDCLDDPRPDQRVRGLWLLAEVRDPDLFDWCAMFVDDEDATVRLAALRTMLRCEGGTPEGVEPLAGSEDRRVRAAAIAVLAEHARDWPRWIERGLRDAEACVRVEAARFLGKLDPRRHRPLFDLALHDPNPDVASRARKLLSGR